MKKQHYLNLGDIKEFHIEMTNRCNAACPQCARNIHGGATNPNLEFDELSLEDIDSVFTKDLCPQLSLVMMCGNYGDPMVANDTLEAIKLLKKRGVQSVWMYTNGSGRNEEWWSELGRVLNSGRDRVAFSIDGLEDTNHLYRRNTDWDKIMASASSFIAAGGRARWEYLVFKHNEHQVEMAIKLAKQMGFHSFRLRKTSRFARPTEKNPLGKTPVLGEQRDKSLEEVIYLLEKQDLDNLEVEYFLEKPTNSRFRNVATTDHLSEVLKEYGTFENYMNLAQIRCIYKEKFKRYFISANAKLWPCCYIPVDTSTWYLKNQYRDDLGQKIVQLYGENFNNLRTNSLTEILKHPWFKEKLVESWSKDLSAEENPRLKKCARTCGVKFNPILSQTEDIAF